VKDKFVEFHSSDFKASKIGLINTKQLTPYYLIFLHEHKDKMSAIVYEGNVK